ncbi:MAG: NAD kinase [Methylophilaceae bacterium]|nr:NAD kinase [Methylophilaceae bacterium]
MKTAFKTIALIGKYKNPETRDQLLTLAQFLTGHHLNVFMEEDTALHSNIPDYRTLAIDKIGKNSDLAIVLGGDGTMLTAARALIGDEIPLVGINRGHFGFLTDLSAEQMLDGITNILAGKFDLEKRMLLFAKVLRDGQVVSQGYVLNDVVVSRGSMASLIELEVSIDGHFVHKQRSDGLIVATPTGTTAYSLSAGGPILHPSLDAIALVPICPHALSNRPIAINSASKIEITLLRGEDTRVHLDGQLNVAFHEGDQVLVQRADKTITLLHPLGHNHYDMLRKKLHWG